jgi:hypothetical protein
MTESDIPYSSLGDSYGWIREHKHHTSYSGALIDVPPEVDSAMGGDDGTMLDGLGSTLDEKLEEIRRYHHAHGFRAYLMQTIRRFFVSMIGVSLFTMFTLTMDWNRLSNCLQEKSSEACGSLFVPLSENTNMSGWFWWFVLWMLNIQFALYFVFVIFRSFINRIGRIYLCDRFYNRVLGINSKMIERGLSWNDVVIKIVNYHSSGNIPSIFTRGTSGTGVVCDLLSPRIVAILLHRTDDIVSSLVREMTDDQSVFGNILSSGVPLLQSVQGGSYSAALEWVFRSMIIGGMWDKAKMSKTASEAALKMKMKLRILGVLSCLFGWSILAFHISQTFFKNVQRLTNKETDKSQYRWTRYACTTLRRPAEDDQDLAIRFRDITKPVEAAIHCYPDYFLKELLSCINFPISLTVGLIILFTFNDTALLFNTPLAGRPLVVYLTVLGFIAYCLRNYLSGFDSNLTFDKMDEEQSSLLVGTLLSLFPASQDHGAQRGKSLEFVLSPNSGQVRNVSLYQISQRMNSYYRHGLLIFLSELLGVIQLPKMLLYTLPSKAEAIIRFLDENTVIDPRLGVISRVHHHHDGK